jgi:predicted metal-dependent hydrolase
MPFCLCSSLTPKIVSDRRALRSRVDHWARRLRVAPRTIRVQRMVHKWGSCSSSGTITLAADLVHRPSEFQDFVIVHELLHLRIQNHGRLFKAVMTVHMPGWRNQSLFR